VGSFMDYEFIVKFMMKMKENRRLFSLNQAFEETAKVFKMTPEETERKYVELKDLI
jgi:homoaconitase/3-isopropylmalate dehydratase large subunit